MRKINLVQVLKSMAKKFWLPILMAAIGAGGMFVVDKIQQDVPTATWTLNNRYVISISGRQDYESYLYEEKMAAVVNDLLGRDEELREIWRTLNKYSTTDSFRRIDLSLQGENKETLLQAECLIFEKMQTYLSEEFAQAVTITLESTEVKEEASVEKIPSKKTIVLGALLGLSTGLAILLVAEYVKSPNYDERMKL